MINTVTARVSFDSPQEEITYLKLQVNELTTKVNWYEEQFRLSKQREFGRSSEKSAPEQLGIFNEAEVESKPDAPEKATIEVSYTRRKGKETKEEN